MANEYAARIHRVQDYIENNIDANLTLETLASVACFSRFHFHRVFRAMTGETIQQFISRVRLERAATQLVNNKERSITEIALDNGFSSSATFARAFKDMFQMSASQARSNPGKLLSNLGKTVSKPDKESLAVSSYFDLQTGSTNWRIEMKQHPGIKANVKVHELPEMHVAYIRHTGPYKGDGALFGRLFGKLMSWAGPRNLFVPGKTRCLSVYHDNPDITDDDKLRLSVCLTVEADTPVEGEVNKMTLAGGTYAIANFELKDDEYEAAWNSIYSTWLPESGYQPDDKPPLEFYLNNPQDHPEGKHIVDICVPVKPL